MDGVTHRCPRCPILRVCGLMYHAPLCSGCIVERVPQAAYLLNKPVSETAGSWLGTHAGVSLVCLQILTCPAVPESCNEVLVTVHLKGDTRWQ